MTSHEIEFLPKRYREKRKKNNIKVSRILLIVIMVGGMASVLLYQLACLHSVNRQVAAIDKQNEKVMQLMQEVESRRAKVVLERHHANLLTFLDHPYPKSQIISALVNPLSREITITRLQITQEQVANPNAKPPSEKGQAAPKGHPMELDLKTLISEAKTRRVMVEVEGTTDDTSSLYTYLASLHQAEIIESAKIESIDPHQKSDGSEFSNFTAHVRVKRGYLTQFGTLLGQAVQPAPGQEGIR